jgi:hypothetical protein
VLTATCQNCGAAKDAANYADPTCPSCTARRNEAQQHFRAEHPDAPESDVLYAGRQALMQVAHHANRNFTDPRGFSAGRGMIPTPPQSDRGSTGA